MHIREAEMSDAPGLVILMEQLGYPTTIDKYNHRLDTILANPSYHTLVAVLDGKIVGMAGLWKGLSYEYDGSFVRIAAFVVDANYRRMGIGERLIQEAESWARDQGAFAIALNSGNREERKGAHLFYYKMGYEAKSTGFSKSLL